MVPLRCRAGRDFGPEARQEPPWERADEHRSFLDPHQPSSIACARLCCPTISLYRVDREGPHEQVLLEPRMLRAE